MSTLALEKTQIRSRFPGEVAIIRKVRQDNLSVGPMKLAKQIVRGDFSDQYGPVYRTLLSAYSVIRRFDAALTAAGRKAKS